MAVTVKKAILWRKEIDNRPGMLAELIDESPLAISVLIRRKEEHTDSGNRKNQNELPPDQSLSLRLCSSCGAAEFSQTSVFCSNNCSPALQLSNYRLQNQ